MRARFCVLLLVVIFFFISCAGSPSKRGSTDEELSFKRFLEKYEMYLLIAPEPEGEKVYFRDSAPGIFHYLPKVRAFVIWLTESRGGNDYFAVRLAPDAVLQFWAAGPYVQIDEKRIASVLNGERVLVTGNFYSVDDEVYAKKILIRGYE